MLAPSDVQLTIGALSQATGVPVNTLRTWERRYGFLAGDRTEGGHRLYATSVVEHVRLVVRALDAGHRPAQVLSAPMSALVDLVGGAPFTAATTPIDAWLAATRSLDGPALQRGFAEEAARVGLPGFVEGGALPFLRRLGEEWSAGELRVFHEHFASERLVDFLAGAWRPLSDSARGRAVVCASFPGDQHDLGLHMAAALLAVDGRRVVFLGRDTPTADIADAARLSGAGAVVVSVGPGATDPATHLRALRAGLPANVGLFVGGPSAPEAPGATHVSDLGRLPSLVGT